MTSDRPHAAALLAVGDELLAGAHPDLNSPYLAARLWELGRHVERVVTVGDDEGKIAAALADLARRAPLVVASGGLGPTLDDVTRHGAARAAGRALVRSEEAWAQVCAWYEGLPRRMPASNERQALVPEGALVLPNGRGTAPGFRLALGEAQLFVLPGPPAELQGMVEDRLVPWLVAHPVGDEIFRVRCFHLVDLSESVFAEGAGEWMVRDANPLMGVTVKGGVLSVRLVARGATAAEAEQRLEERGAAFLERFGRHVFSETTPELALALGRELLARRITVTTAESCTGGLLAGQLTRVPGISALFREGFVTYDDRVKVERLGVDAALIEALGTVSPEVAEAMARGAAARTGARLSLAITGVAGPGGGTPAKPVGMVCFALVLDGVPRTLTRHWPDAGRDRVREWSTARALALALEALGTLGSPPGDGGPGG